MAADAKPSKFKITFLVSLILTIAVLGCLRVYVDESYYFDFFRDNRKYYSLSSLLDVNNLKSSKFQACAFPHTDPFDPEVMATIAKQSPLSCAGGTPSFVYLDGATLRINQSKVAALGKTVDFCQYTPLRLKRCNELEPHSWSQRFNQSIELPPEMEHLYIRCTKESSGMVGETYISRPIRKPDVEKRCKKLHQQHIQQNSPSETLNILLLGIDAMSWQNLARCMPKTKQFVEDTLDARELKTFNKLGYDTFANVLPLLTGHNVQTLKEARSFPNGREVLDRVDDLFLWHVYKNAGYRTAVQMDFVTTAFQYPGPEWKNPPFDYYYRAGPVQMFKTWKKKDCVGETRHVTLLKDYWLQFTSEFNKSSPYFGYSFLGWLAHDDLSHACRGDEMYLEFFQKLQRLQVLNNTLLMFYSDHGPRFGKFRKTRVGRIETHTPFFYFVFPPWFEKKYPKEMANFRVNQNRLTTFFDVHSTLVDLLHFRGKNNAAHLKNTNGTSLFQTISPLRSCQDAQIPFKYCVCMKSSHLNVSSDLSQRLAGQMFRTIVNSTSSRRHMCAQLRLENVLFVDELLSVTSTSGDSHYKVSLVTSPGMGEYVGIVVYNRKSGDMRTEGRVLRVNRYHGQDWCTTDMTLKPFCFCKKQESRQDLT